MSSSLIGLPHTGYQANNPAFYLIRKLDTRQVTRRSKDFAEKQKFYTEL